MGRVRTRCGRTGANKETAGRREGMLKARLTETAGQREDAISRAELEDQGRKHKVRTYIFLNRRAHEHRRSTQWSDPRGQPGTRRRGRADKDGSVVVCVTGTCGARQLLAHVLERQKDRGVGEVDSHARQTGELRQRTRARRQDAQ
ncbi:hypothetical protein ERJ75_000599100 [Trypanosoma vivax]|nr:hypothetical protein ERJ75_000599100 [Trypanosoma vivax]